MTCALAALAVLLLLPGPERAHATASDDEEYGVLFTAPGVDETYAYCAGCHSERIVAQQGLTRDGWVEILEWMVEEQGMGEIEEPDLTLILDYLTKHYNEDRPNFPRTN
ncbi:MAG: aldehyde dehydrogenase [Pseudomonadota bacterium]